MAEMEDGTLEEALELAYWRFDAMQGRQGEPYKSRPQSERDAFKGAVRALWSARGGAGLTAEDLDALRWLRNKGHIPTGRSVECDDPQCGDSTWDHDCNAGWEEIPEAKRAIAVLDKLLGKETDRG